METHSGDPIDESNGDFGANSEASKSESNRSESNWEPDPWDRMADQWKSLGRKLRDTYRESASDDGPTDEDIKAAFSTLGSAWDRLAGAFGMAIRDEQVRQNAKRAATGFFEAVGAAFSELGSELRRSEAGREPDTSNEATNRHAEGDETNPGRVSEP